MGPKFLAYDQHDHKVNHVTKLYVTKPRVNETPPTTTHAQNVGITRLCVPPPCIIGVT